MIEIGTKRGSPKAKSWALCDTSGTHPLVLEIFKSRLVLVCCFDRVCVRRVTGSSEGDTSTVILELFSFEEILLKLANILNK